MTAPGRMSVAGMLHDSIPSHPFLVLNGSRWEHPPKNLRDRMSRRARRDRHHDKIEWSSQPVQVALAKEITPEGQLRVWTLEPAHFTGLDNGVATSVSIFAEPDGDPIARVPLYEAIFSQYGVGLELEAGGLRGEGGAT